MMAAAADGQESLLHVAFGKRSAAVAAPPDASLRQLGEELATQFGVAPHTIKLLLPHPAKGALRIVDAGERSLADAGIRPGMRLKMMASPADAVAAVAAAEQAQAADRIPGFDQELRRQLRRAGLEDAAKGGGGAALPAGPYTFRRFQTWGRAGLTPPPGEALKLLHRLASDPGIVGVMSKHKWEIGLLSEMPPEGKVGVSPVCILGVNINRGQEISLRLRTDDLKGFRRYDRIRETLIHELAHQVWGEHDHNFKALNSQLRRECESFDWRSPAARSLAGPAFEGSVRYDLPPERQTAMQETAASSGRTLRQLAGGAAGEAQPPADARQAAAEAALRRAGGSSAEQPAVAGPGAAATLQPPAEQQQQQQAGAQQAFRKGDRVLYRQRDGTLEQAEVVSVDLSVQPPSYGVQLQGSRSIRETEASRLQPLPAQQQQEEQQAEQVEGLGHRDAETEAKEAAVAALET